MNAAGESKRLDGVYIVEPDNQGWIIERLMRDIAAELEQRGIPTKIGTARDYAGEAVIFNSRYLLPFRDQRAAINSLFVTHIDDRIREAELRRTFENFNSHVCLSAHDADFVAGLKGNTEGVVGIDLPPRDLTVRPARLGMFSAFYPDGRKNESWLTQYFRERPAEYRSSFTLCFLGADWEGFAQELGNLDLSYEIYRYARSLPGEYQLYKEILPSLDALIYLGFDGGAMSAYDAMNAGIDLIATDISYHRDLDSDFSLVKDREAFFATLDRLHARVARKRATLQARSVSAYVDRLVAHWQSLLDGPPVTEMLNEEPLPRHEQAVEEFRSRYKPLTYSRLRSAAIRLVLVSLGRR